MDLELRTVLTSESEKNVDFAFSSAKSSLVIASPSLVSVQSTATEAISSRISTVSKIEKVVHVGGAGSFLVFQENGYLTSYGESSNGIEFLDEEKLDSGPRPVAHVSSSASGLYAAFSKEDSPSVWCVALQETGRIREVYKLRSDIEGGQSNVTALDGAFAKMRGKVATNAKTRTCPIVAIATHPNRPLVAAAYSNGLVRVWDARKKEQRSHFDAQLLINEKITGMALHPEMNVLVLCTSQGRIISFRLQNTLFKRGDEPTLATSKSRESRRSFLRLCFVGSNPAYIMVLTKTRRLLFRMINSGGQIVHSARYLQPTRPLPLSFATDATAVAAAGADVQKALTASGSSVSVKHDSLFELTAISFKKGGNIYLYQRRMDRLPYIARPLCHGIDSKFTDGRALSKPINVSKDALFVQSGCLFRYSLGDETVTRLCKLPDGDVRSLKAGLDGTGAAIAALVFMYIDEEAESLSERSDTSTFARYVLCTKRGDTVEWNVSEPADGRSGCFLNREGEHDQVLIISNTGHAGSIFSFSSDRKRPTSRGVRRIKLGPDRADTIFRAPFCSWMSVVYFDPLKRRLTVSRNAFRNYSDNASAERRMKTAESDDGYLMDNDTALKLRPKEVVLDVRWQPRWTQREGVRWLGAVLTNMNLYLVQDVFSELARLDFATLEHNTVKFVLPTIVWMGPSVAILFGSYFYSVAMDATVDFVAGLSHAENASILLGALPNRLIYAKPSGPHDAGEVSVASRPYSPMSVLVRSALSVPWAGPEPDIDEISNLLRSKDATQGSEELIEALIRRNLAPIAYLVCVSAQGKNIVPPFKRASFLARIGDIRGALDVVESEYARLPDSSAFHAGKELHRLTQRIMNMAIVCGDFSVAKRCSGLLGRRGTFEAFVESEGGFPALNTVMEFAGNTGNQQISNALRPLLQKSAESCIASDAARFPSSKEMKNTRRAVESLDVRSVSLGTEDQVAVGVRELTAGATEGGRDFGQPTVLSAVKASRASERLEILANSSVVTLTSADDASVLPAVAPVAPVVDELATPAIGGQETAPAQLDDEDEFIFGSRKDEAASGIPAKTNIVYNAPSAALVPPGNDGATALRERASSGLEKGMRKVDGGDYEAALSDFESGIKAVGKVVKSSGHRPGQVVGTMLDSNLQTLLSSLVGYRMGMKLFMAMDQVRSSSHASTRVGQVTIAQLASAMGFSCGFLPRHAIGALNLACDANMVVGNYGTASKALAQLRSVAEKDQLSDAAKQTLRAKYAKCQSFNLADSNPRFSWRLCYESLRVIAENEQIMQCSVCVAQFSSQSGLRVGDSCTACSIGSVVPGTVRRQREFALGQ